MELDLISVLWYIILIYVIVQLVRFIRADADLTLLWAESFGNKPADKLCGKVVWITGASSGIGEELAYQLAKTGASLILSARRENELHRVKQNCIEQSRLQEKDILVLPLDLTARGSHEAITKTAIEHFGKIDILLNNGGRSQRSLCLETDLDVYQALMELNYLGTVSLVKCVLPHLVERKRGQIVTISSVAGLAGVPLASGYSASKHALQGFFNSLRSELADFPEITISSVCPGPVQSQILKNAFTGDLGKAVNSDADQSHKMSTSRCVRLILVGMANNVKEMWISEQPFLLFNYMWQYTPTWAWWITDLFGKRRVKNFKAGMDADFSYFTKAKTS
ncbi:dehydrogenase/reductase SDR family member 7-like isoform X1 [Acipenser ruthenus]|uniref:dehydrogenase/reductase SDR family member 7-like isoform X1 n=1 Tax=Acipenser ruthenus TaxID=7906 RepID=UPI002741C380|nr:dehydrogenase/reductase SDR family member 7-like isoform X1 [Acipenser ruthenus]XP_058847919.1 dehydrogenase/reductase SDR family member 7-like isoform X1 [Acipenser ruthenus]XP_058847920.1 dehydrogenase/reductase SDR family member 7-like isoform X1 [Acipenser ruthenus]